MIADNTAQNALKYLELTFHIELSLDIFACVCNENAKSYLHYFCPLVAYIIVTAFPTKV